MVYVTHLIFNCDSFEFDIVYEQQDWRHYGNAIYQFNNTCCRLLKEGFQIIHKDVDSVLNKVVIFERKGATEHRKVELKVQSEEQ